jgi:hypothetical protein
MFKLKTISYDFFIIVILIVLTIIFTIFAGNKVSALQTHQGPPIVCGKSSEITESINKYEEEDFIVLMQSTPEAVYFILYRNISTGAWSVIAYNTPHLSAEHACLMLGGHNSFIIPDIEQMKDIIDKQNKGLDKSVPKFQERES